MEEEEEEEANVSVDVYEMIEEQEEKAKAPMLKFGASKTRDITPKSLMNSQGAKKNPFKVFMLYLQVLQMCSLGDILIIDNMFESQRPP
jgi:hypothetical protein